MGHMKEPDQILEGNDEAAYRETERPLVLVEVGDTLRLRIEYYVAKPNIRFRCVAMFLTQGVCAFGPMERTEEVRPEIGYYSSTLTIPPHLLAESEYSVIVSLFESMGMKRQLVMVPDALTFQVYDSMNGESARGDCTQNFAGVMRPKLDWEHPTVTWMVHTIYITTDHHIAAPRMFCSHSIRRLNTI